MKLIDVRSASRLQRVFAALALGIVAAFLTTPLRAQNQAYTIAPGGSIDIPYTGSGHWYFETNPAPSTATMSRLDANKVAEYPWGGTTANGNFYDDVPNNSENRIYSGEYLRIYGNSTPAGTTITVGYDINPILSGHNPTYTISVAVQTPGAQVTSLNITDPSPTAADTVHWQAVFDHAITGVTAANFSFTNAANITPTPTVTNLAPTTSGDNTKWTVTVNSSGTGTGILGLNWVGHASESPAVPNQFSGQEYQFSSYPLVTTEPVASAYAAVGATPPTLTCVANDRTGAPMNYQWKAGSSTNPGAATTISGATSSSYTPPTSSTADTASYYCTAYTNANNSYYSTDSTTATLTFETPPSVTSTGGNAYGLNNTTVSLAVTAAGSYVQYQWYQGNSGDTTHPVSGATSAQFTTPALTKSTNYWAQVSDSHIGSAYNKNGATQTAYIITSVTPFYSTLTATVAAGFNQPMEVTITDSAGSVVHGAKVVFTVPTASKATFAGGQTTYTTTADSSGNYTSAGLTAGTLAGSFTGTAQVYPTTGNPTSSTIGLTINPGAAAKLLFVTGAPSTATAGVAFSPAPALELQDAYANVLSNAATISVARLTGTDALQGVTSVVTGSNGTATFTNLSYDVAETMTFQATSGGLTANSGSVVVSHGAGAPAVTAGNGQVAAPGTAFGTPLKIHVADVYGNVVAGANVTFTAPASGASATLGGTTTTDVSGNVSVTATANATPGAYAITANITPPAANPASFSLSNFTQLQLWRYTNFAGNYQSTGTAADTVAPHGDGVPNLLKYAFDLNPQGADATPMTATGTKGLPLVGNDGNGHLTLTFVRRKAASVPAITYQPQFSNTVTTSGFAVNAAATTSTPVAIDGTWERVTVTDSVVAGQSQAQRFARVLVSDP